MVMEDYLTHSQLRLFADDRIIYMPIKSQHDCNKLQQDIDAAARWESNWLMAFHPDKCSVLSVTKKKQPIQHNYILHYHILESVSSAKYLGITVQSNLKWDKYINNITSKGNKALGASRFCCNLLQSCCDLMGMYMMLSSANSLR
jgi:hypothetical protein